VDLSAVPRSTTNEVAAMAEVEIDILREFPKPWTDEFPVRGPRCGDDGVGDACPLVPGKHYEDWEIGDPMASRSPSSAPSETRSAAGE